MPANVAELQIKVLSDQVLKAEQRLDKLEKQAKKTSAGVGKLSAAMGKAGLAASAAAAVVGVAALWSTFNNVRVLQKLQAQLKTATGSVEGARIAFAELQGIAKQMPNSLAEITQAFITLKNLGLTPSENAILSYGNTAAAMGKDLSQFIEAVADATTREFERLKEFGIRSSQEGNKVTFTFRGMSTQIGNSAMEIEKYLIDLGNTEFATSMSDQMDTIDNQISMLKDAWFKFTTELAATKLGKFTNAAIKSATEELEEAAEELQISKFSGTSDATLAAIRSATIADLEILKNVQSVLFRIAQKTAVLGFNELMPESNNSKGEGARDKAIADQIRALEVKKTALAANEALLAAFDKRQEGRMALADLQLKIDKESLPIREKILGINQQIANIEDSLLGGTFSSSKSEIEQIEKLREAREKLNAERIKARDDEAKAKEKEAQIEQQLEEQKLAAKKQFYSDLASLAKDSNSKLFKIVQAAALADATMRGGQAVMTAYATGGSFPMNLLAGAMMAAKVAAEIKTIQGGNFEQGGFVGGSSFSGDNVPINVNSGEAILNASQQRNFMQLANGNSASGKSTIIIKNFGVETTTEDSRGSNGEMITIITNRVRRAVNSDVTQDFLNGGPISRSAENSYGLRRGG
jgi:hypothetical protein